jgi:hypothetical protein
VASAFDFRQVSILLLHSETQLRWNVAARQRIFQAMHATDTGLLWKCWILNRICSSRAAGDYYYVSRTKIEEFSALRRIFEKPWRSHFHTGGHMPAMKIWQNPDTITMASEPTCERRDFW